MLHYGKMYSWGQIQFPQLCFQSETEDVSLSAVLVSVDLHSTSLEPGQQTIPTLLSRSWGLQTPCSEGAASRLAVVEFRRRAGRYGLIPVPGMGSEQPLVAGVGCGGGVYRVGGFGQVEDVSDELQKTNTHITKLADKHGRLQSRKKAKELKLNWT